MGRLELKGVCAKGWRLYYRRKVAGQDIYIRLPAADGPVFAEAYQRAAQPDQPRLRTSEGWLAALVAEFKRSAEGKAGKPKTLSNRQRYLDQIQAEHGHRSVKGVRAPHIYRMRDEIAEKPGKANVWLATFKLLMSIAVQRGWRDDNPATGIKPLELGEREFWPADIAERALETASPMLRLAIVTELCSGVRIGDAVRLQHRWIIPNPGRAGGYVMELRATKNETDIAIPMHPIWLTEIAKVPLTSATLLYDRRGKPFSEKSLQERLRAQMKRIGAFGFTFHGLRKNAACYLVEQGLSGAEAGSILAMTPETVRFYSRRARARLMAFGSADRVPRGDVLPMKGNAKCRHPKITR
jgi:integrase